MCQVQTLKGARAAVDAGAEIIIAQGGEAGGHAQTRGTFPLVLEIADLLAKSTPDTLLCAAGGVADGRGLAAALMLGADGVLVGSRFCACAEALVFPGWHEALLSADGDVMVQTSVVDITRGRDWPDEYKIRVLRNALIKRWQDREEELQAHQAQEAARYEAAAAAGDTDNYGVIIGEAVGLIHTIEPAGVVLERMVAEAEILLKAAPSYATAGKS
jgi:nitronate monooxygenase